MTVDKRKQAAKIQTRRVYTSSELQAKKWPAVSGPETIFLEEDSGDMNIMLQRVKNHQLNCVMPVIACVNVSSEHRV
jgi:hypothetical protein